MWLQFSTCLRNHSRHQWTTTRCLNSLHHTKRHTLVSAVSSRLWFSSQSTEENRKVKPLNDLTPPSQSELEIYFNKFNGIEGKSSPSATPTEVAIAGVGSFIGIGTLSLLHFGIATIDATMIVGSFGASSVLIFGAPIAPFSQPRNVIGGHVLSAFCGICANQFIPLDMPFIAGPVAVSLATMMMMATRTVHPPAGGTALLAAVGSAHISSLGFYFLVPTAVGSSILVAVGALYNNLHKNRQYPQYWL
mmetsp:Transcript_14476/g.21775  ORF Transcript_14476/g.21775 Transcript_14476/m.21775 type:complete len:248 (+) Transcript_14476:53-796(+)